MYREGDSIMERVTQHVYEHPNICQKEYDKNNVLHQYINIYSIASLDPVHLD